MISRNENGSEAPEGKATVASEGVHDRIHLDGRQLSGLVAVAAQWAWFFLVMFSGMALLPTPATLHIEPVFREICFVSMALAFLLLLGIGSKILRGKALIGITSLSLLSSPAICLCIVLVNHPADIFLPAEVLSWAAFGVASAILQYEISFFLKELPGRTTVLVLGAAATIGGGIYLLTSSTGGAVPYVVICALPVICLAALYASGTFAAIDGSINDIEPADAGRHIGSSLHVQPAQPLYGILFGLMIGIGIHLSILESNQFPVWMALSFCVAGPVMIGIAALPRRIDAESLQWVLLPISVVAMLAALLGDGALIPFCCALLAFCYSLFEQLHTLTLSEIMREQPGVSPYVFLSGKLCFFFGTAMGWGASVFILRLEMFGTVIFDATFILAAAIVIAVVSYIGRPHNRARFEAVETAPQKDSSDILEEACAAIAAEAGLSPRQAEVFVLLAKGRNAPYIEEALVVSYHTVKAHIYRIYQKLDVHSQQELINIVESRMWPEGKTQSTSGFRQK